MGRMLFISNNPEYASLARRGLETVFMEKGSSLEVLIAARDKIHQGWRLLHHPLYGNIRPRLQPFRSILLAEPASGTPDLHSLELISTAVAQYDEVKDALAYPWSVPQSLKADCALLDRELLRETLVQTGIMAA